MSSGWLGCQLAGRCVDPVVEGVLGGLVEPAGVDPVLGDAGHLGEVPAERSGDGASLSGEGETAAGPNAQSSMSQISRQVTRLRLRRR